MDQTIPALLLWGMFVGVDLVSFPQIMIARPIVAGSVAGFITGDPVGGIQIAVIMELFALEVVPVGGARYPDYGPATVAAAYAVSGSPGVLALGLATLIGLVTAYAGGIGIQIVRRANTTDVERCRSRLDSGDRTAVRGLQFRGIMRDALRALSVTAAGLVIGYAARQWLLVDVGDAVLLTIAAVGAALAAGLIGAMKITGRRSGVRWIALGAISGLIWVNLL